MAMKWMVFALMVLVIGCGGDDAEGGEVECEGQHLKENYLDCVGGEEAYFEEWNKLYRADNPPHIRNARWDEPEDDEVMGCEESSVVSHFCSFDPEEHDEECSWDVGAYQRIEGGKPTYYCYCDIHIRDSARNSCGSLVESEG